MQHCVVSLRAADISQKNWPKIKNKKKEDIVHLKHPRRLAEIMGLYFERLLMGSKSQ